MELDVPVIGILRGVESSFFHEIMEASFANGLQAIEITMNTEQAEQIVARNRDSVPEGRLLGMGTIRNLEEAKRASDAGVNASNLKEYFEAGAAAVGVSASLFGREALKDKNLGALADNVKNFIECCLDCTDKV